ncbi:SH3 domain-containing protein [Reinekea sp.]|jgi:hypothetical protein|uniref:SH3 domain-containing protein n=1 Tax=Reinekea sp. TaxID=1970455 RepID=UPI0039898A5A
MAETKQVTTHTDSSYHFWESLSDHTQAAVQLALQWLAYVYPSSELQIDRTLSKALPYSDTDLSSRWAQFLDENDVEEHVEALTWMAETISSEQIPFLVETCWRLVLADHELPTHVPLALRILGQIIGINEQRLHEIGGDVFREFLEVDEAKSRAPLLPVDPRYLDRIEWRMYGHTATSRNIFEHRETKKTEPTGKVPAFIVGFILGAAALALLVFGPLQLGRISVARMQHDNLPKIALTPAPTVPVEVEASPPAVAPEIETPVESQVSPIIIEETNPAEVVVEPTVSTVNEAPASATEKVLMTISANVLNVRAQATVDSEVVAKLGKDAKVWAYPDEAIGLWMKITFDDKTGYASSRFMTEAN